MKRPVLWLLLLAAAALAAGGYWWFQSRPAPGPYPGMGGDFTLESARGPVSLSDFRGKVVALYFGYTSCPDVCPTSLGALAAALRGLEPEELAQVQPIFVSVDPERDTPERLADYARYFHPRMIGLTGSLAEIESITKRYGAYFRKVPVAGSELGYAVDHSSVIYLIDRRGVLVDMIRHSDSPKVIRNRLRKVLGQDQAGAS